MTDEIRCKRIIAGKTYNTETAMLLGRWDQEPLELALFKTRHGAYFYHARDYADELEELAPVSAEKARELMEEHCSAEQFEAEFGEIPEPGDPEARITLRIPETLRKRVAAIAEARNQSLNAWILRCIERAATTEQPR